MPTLASVVATLRSQNPSIPPADLSGLIEWVTQLTRHQQLVNPAILLSSDQYHAIEAGITKLASGVPLSLITGETEFFGRTFWVEPDVLLPRPETERVVEVALDTIDEFQLQHVYELGSGSGVICISISLSRPDTIVSTWDINPNAIALTQRNQVKRNAPHITTRCEDFFSGVIASTLPHRHLIVSNPPYIRQDVIPTLDPSVLRFDPITALDGGPDGLQFYTNLLSRYPKSPMVLEIGFDQGADIKTRGHQSGFHVDVIKDYAGHDRIARLLPAN